jgi:hypothetical protein
MEFWTPEKSKKMTLDSFDNSTPSIFSCLVPYDSPRQEGDYFMNEYPNPLDVTGLYSTTNPALEHMSSNREIHYATAPFYGALHRFDNSTPADAMSFGSYNRFNTMCFQGHQAMFNPTSRTYDLVQQNSGHWGSRSVPIVLHLCYLILCCSESAISIADNLCAASLVFGFSLDRIYQGKTPRHIAPLHRFAFSNLFSCFVFKFMLTFVLVFRNRLWKGEKGPPKDARASLVLLHARRDVQPQHGHDWVLGCLFVTAFLS